MVRGGVTLRVADPTEAVAPVVAAVLDDTPGVEVVTAAFATEPCVKVEWLTISTPTARNTVNTTTRNHENKLRVSFTMTLSLAHFHF